MPRSATGICRGFTLLEVLVVVAILAIVTTLVVLRLGEWGNEHAPERQLERLAALIGVQCEQAMFQARARGIRLDESGYDFWQQGPSGWLPAGDGGVLRERSWQGIGQLRLEVGGHRAGLDAAERPQLVCRPLGELTPFELTLATAGERWRLSGRGDGQTRIERR